MSESRDAAGEPGVQTGNITANQGNVATGSNINQGPSNSPIILIQNTNNPISPSEEAESTSIAKLAPASATVPPRCYDGRSELLRLEAVSIDEGNQWRIFRLSDGLKGSRCLLLDAESMVLSLATAFTQAMVDGLDSHYRAACWLTPPTKATLMSLAPLFPLIGLSPVALQSKNPLAQAITIAKALRQHPTLLVLQGFDDASAKSLPADFSALIEFANEDDIGRSSVVILCERPTLASRWDAKLMATAGY